MKNCVRYETRQLIIIVGYLKSNEKFRQVENRFK